MRACSSVDSGPTSAAPASTPLGLLSTSARVTATFVCAASSTRNAPLPTSATIAPLPASLNPPSAPENTDGSPASQRALPLRSTQTLACA